MQQSLHREYEYITGPSFAVVSYSPITLSSPYRPLPLQVRVSAPVSGTDLPVIIFSHGFGNSMDGYAPLVYFWASHGFLVIQATYLDSKRLGNFDELPYKGDVWRIRIDDVHHILEQLEDIENSCEAIKGRISKNKIAAAGHSFGGHTTSMLLGSRMILENNDLGQDYSDERIKVGVLLAAGGRGGDAMTDFAKEHLPYLNQDYSHMNKPTLVVAGDKDFSALTTMGPKWFTDAYHLSPGANALVNIYNGEHMLGGISGYLVTETTDEDPRKVEAVQLLTLAYLKTFFDPNDDAWMLARSFFNKERLNVAAVKIRS